MSCEESPESCCGPAAPRETECAHCGMPIEAPWAACEACDEAVCEFSEGEDCSESEEAH